MTTNDRAASLAHTCSRFAEYVGNFGPDDLMDWVDHELGDKKALDSFLKVGDIRTKAVAPIRILHILSGNSPHAALQSLLRGLLIGSHNVVKLPSSGLPEVEQFRAALPDELAEKVTFLSEIDEATFASAQVVIAIGSDTTMASVQQRVRPHQRFIPHGHKVSIGLVASPSETAAQLAANDIGLYNQQGCQSLHAVYVKGSEQAAKSYAFLLAKAMADFESRHPRGPLPLSDAGAITNLRETMRYRAANLSHSCALWESEGSTAWTVIYEKDATLRLSCLNRVVYVKPWPADLDELGSEIQHLSTIAMHPLDELLDEVEALAPPRLCPLGNAQQPPLFWHHDGFSPLASLVQWRDIH